MYLYRKRMVKVLCECERCRLRVFCATTSKWQRFRCARRLQRLISLESIMWFNVVAFWDNYCFTLLFSFFSLEYVLLLLTIWFGTTKFLKINRQNKWSFFLCFRPHPNSLSHISLDWFSFLLLLPSVVVVGKVFLSFLAGFLFAKNIVFLFYKQRIKSHSSRGLDTRTVINGVFKWNHKHCWNCCPLVLVVL